MERLTTNKNVSEMGMFKLALNCCYITQDGNTRYRDYAKDIDARDFARVITENFAKDVLPLNDESFDEEMMENLMYDPLTDINALIAVFYRNMWAMAEMMEKAFSESKTYDPDRVLHQLEERTAFLKDCTKYGNKTAEQQSKSYDTMMMYEVKDLVDDLLEIVKAGGADAKTDS